MSQQLEQLFMRRNPPAAPVRPLTDASLPSLRSLPSYNLHDYLPPSRDCRTISHKTATEPSERREAEFSELLRQKALLEQEKLALTQTVEVLRQSNRQLKERGEQREQREQQNQALQRQLAHLTPSRTPRLAIDKNCIHSQVFPIQRQTYQVSVQTEPTIEQPSAERQVPVSSEMQHIYHRLDSLKMAKRNRGLPETVARGWTDRESLRQKDRTKERQSDKENNMRASNAGWRTKSELVRAQTLQLSCLPFELGQRLVACFLDDPFP